jgi:hypothetical protein
MAMTFRDRFPFGMWTSADATARFSFDFKGSGCVWTERNSAGATLVRTVSLIRKISNNQIDYWQIERPNDADVLRFLGCRDSVIAAILARGPNPSFMKLIPGDSTFQSKWNGLLWTLTPHGQLATMTQPGADSSKEKIFGYNKSGSDDPYFIETRAIE